MTFRVREITWPVVPALMLLSAFAQGPKPQPNESILQDLKQAESCVQKLQQQSGRGIQDHEKLKGVLSGIQRLEKEFAPDQAPVTCRVDQNSVETQAKLTLSWAGGDKVKKLKLAHIDANAFVKEINRLGVSLGQVRPLPALGTATLPAPGTATLPAPGTATLPAPGTASTVDNPHKQPQGSQQQHEGLDLKPILQELGLIDACTKKAQERGSDPVSLAKQADQLTSIQNDLQIVVNDLGLESLQAVSVCTDQAVGTAALERAKAAAKAAREKLSTAAQSMAGRSERGSPGAAQDAGPNFVKAGADLTKIDGELQRFQNAQPAASPNVEPAYLLTVALESAALAVLIWALVRRKKQQKQQGQAELAVKNGIDNAITTAANASQAANGALQQMKTAQERMARAKASLSTPAPRLQDEPPQPFPPEDRQRNAPAESQTPAEPMPLPPAADPNELTGDPVEDYNRYRRAGTHDAEDRLLERYRNSLVQLTCENLEMYRDEDAELLLKKDASGDLMAVMAADGSLTVLPSVGFDPSASRSLFAGIFRFPPGQGAVRLVQAARATPRGGGGSFVVKGTDRGSFESA